MIPVYKGKGYVLNYGSHKEIKLLKHVIKNVEKEMEKRLRERVNLYKLQFGFYARKRNS